MGVRARTQNNRKHCDPWYSAKLEAEPTSRYSKIGFTQKMKDVKTYEKSTQDLKMLK